MTSRLFGASVAVLLLSACGSNEAPSAGAPTQAAATAATPVETLAAAPASAGKGAKPDKTFMVGKWAEGGDCSTMVIDFKADGTMDGPVEKWDLVDGKLEMVGMPQRMHLTVVDADTMESRIDGTGEPRTLKRCK